MIEETTPPEAGWEPRTKSWLSYPVGTLARDGEGALYVKTEVGWRLKDGDGPIYSVLGADAFEVRVPGASATPIARPAPARAAAAARFSRKDVERLNALATDVETYDPAFLDDLADRLHAFLNDAESIARLAPARPPSQETAL